jgi:hypothetical protein
VGGGGWTLPASALRQPKAHKAHRTTTHLNGHRDHPGGWTSTVCTRATTGGHTPTPGPGTTCRVTHKGGQTQTGWAVSSRGLALKAWSPSSPAAPQCHMLQLILPPPPNNNHQAHRTRGGWGGRSPTSASAPRLKVDGEGVGGLPLLPCLLHQHRCPVLLEPGQGHPTGSAQVKVQGQDVGWEGAWDGACLPTPIRALGTQAQPGAVRVDLRPTPPGLGHRPTTAVPLLHLLHDVSTRRGACSVQAAEGRRAAAGSGPQPNVAAGDA